MRESLGDCSVDCLSSCEKHGNMRSLDARGRLAETTYRQNRIDFPDFPSHSVIQFNLWSSEDNTWLSLLRGLWHRCNARRVLLAASGDPREPAHLSEEVTSKRHRLPGVATPRLNCDSELLKCYKNGGDLKGVDHHCPQPAPADSRGDRDGEAFCADRALSASLAQAIREAKLYCGHPERTVVDCRSSCCLEETGRHTPPELPLVDGGHSSAGCKNFSSAFMKIPSEFVSGKAIPPLLHFVWLGGHPPPFFETIRQSWAVHNPDLIQALWTDAHVESLLDVLDRKSRSRRPKCRKTDHQDLHPLLVDRPATDAGETTEWEMSDSVPDSQTLVHAIKAFRKESCPGAKSDIARLLILCHYGGIYADVDMEAIKPLPPCLRQCTTVFMGMQRPDAVELGNALIGCSSGHELIRFILQRVGRPYSQWGTRSADQMAVVLDILKLHVARFSPEASELMDSLRSTNDEATNVIERTGPGLLTRATLAWLRDQLNSSSCARCRPQERRSHDYEHKSNTTEATSVHADVVGSETGSKEDDSKPEATSGTCCCILATTCICPPIFFYPVPNHRRKELREGKVQTEHLESSFSYTVHHWRQTWQDSVRQESENEC
ncbi:hypothetical protein TGGT1_205060 [Toxoplasma gondii GT1]|uniref:Glycosyltransferase family 32 protein n=2 Tax=Toxoplasma gondii TaxID=5811 RepID=S7UUF5_TOXGG|nr:hypothetical protein TGGT1_205060 [Toxoplasma gondii GT1]KFG36704.1 glycosyltransferase family 32 protein [Toxoplasma gondii FOU]